MNIREATGNDVDALLELVDSSFDARRLVHERTVLVAEETGDDAPPGELLGFVSYDTWAETVHLSTMVGEPEVVDTLLEEPRRFADAEGIPVEIVVPEDDEELRSVVIEAGFERVGKGPLFDGKPSHRYRYNDT